MQKGPSDNTAGAMERSEAELVEAAMAGGLDAYGELVTAYQDRIYAYVLRMVGNAADAQDIAQETFLRVHRSLGQLASAGAFHSWLYTIAVNTCRNHLKRRNRESARFVSLSSQPTGDEQSVQVPDTTPATSPFAAFEAREVATAVAEAFKALPNIYREVAVLRFQNGLKVREIAEVLDLTVAAVESRLRRARPELCQRLDTLRTEAS